MICMYCFNMNQKKLRDIKSKEPQTDHRPIQDSLVSEEVKVKKSALTEEPGDGKISSSSSSSTSTSSTSSICCSVFVWLGWF